MDMCAGFGVGYVFKGHGRGNELPRRRERHPWSSCHHCRRIAVSAVRERQTGSNVPQLEVLAPLQSELCLGLADRALHAQHDLLGGLGLLPEDRLGLTSVTALLSIITALTLGEEGSLFHQRNSISKPCRHNSWRREHRRVVGWRGSPCQPCTG